MAAYTGILRGAKRNLRKYIDTLTGHFKIYNTFENQMKGHFAIIQVYVAYLNEMSGRFSVLREFTNQMSGRYRVANDSDDQYELYRGVGVEPDLTAAPWETFSSLPHESAALAANNDYYFVTRKRNKYGIISQNIISTLIRIDAGGDQITNPPSNAENI